MTKPPSEPRAAPARITVHDVARVAGVAIGTVSRVVNGAPSVTADVRQRVERAIAQLGWTPSMAAQTMRGGSARMVGFIFSDIRNPLYSSMVKGAEDVLSEHGYMLIVASSDGSPERELSLIELFQRRRADGLLFSVEEESHPAVLRSVGTLTFPVVLLEREMDLPVNAVGADHAAGIEQATRHLIDMGHRRIALISGGANNRVGRDRLAGLTRAHDAADIAVDADLLRLQSFASDYGFRETQMLLGLAQPPTAIIAAGMHLLEGVLPAIRMKGLSIPGDVSLVASNDTPLARLATPAISVIRYDAYALGREAANMLLRRIRKEDPPSRARIDIPVEFVMRASCAAPQA